MASPTDDEMEYLSPSFDPSSLTVPRLRAILVSHDINYPASAKKAQLVEIFTRDLIPRSRKILAARSRIKRTSRGIINMPSSQESMADEDGDGDKESAPMPPPVAPSLSRPKSRRSNQITGGGKQRMSDSSLIEASSGKSQRSNKHARPSDTETDMETPRRPSVRKSRRSESTPTINIEPPTGAAIRPPLGESVFSDENPFQSGSSPPAQAESRRRSGGTSNERRKSSSVRRRTEGVVRTGAAPMVNQDDGIVVPSAETFKIPLTKNSNPKLRVKEDDEIEAGEEFTSEAELELVRARTANGERDVLPLRKIKHAQKSKVVPSSAPWVILLTLFMGYAMWWRQEKVQVGYCGIGRSSEALSNIQIPDWASILLPQCEPCPQHAVCFENLETSCDHDFVLQPHPFSLGGVVPLPPTCEPDGEKARKVKAVADRAIEDLRDRRAKWECGTLADSEGKAAPSLELDEPALKEEVANKRRRGMSEHEFEDLWRSALGEIVGRDEVVQSSDGQSQHLLASTSLARLPLPCAFRRSIRVTLARYRIQLTTLTLLFTLTAYVRSELTTRRAANARVPALVATTLDRLATQAALHSRGDAVEPWISSGQLRDDVLRDEFSAARREGIWKKVKTVVELNANVRASVREGRGGDVSRVWEWIGSVGLLGGGEGGEQQQQRQRLSAGRADERRVSWVGGGGAGDERSLDGLDRGRKWDEGRPIY